MENFTSKRLNFSKFQKKDFKYLYKDLSDYEYTKFYFPMPYIKHNYVELESLISSWITEDSFVFTIYNEEKKIVGLLTVEDFQENISYNQHAEIGIFLLKDHQGKGYAFESLSRIIEILFNTYNISVVYCSVASENYSSINLIKKIGFEYMGKKIKYFFRDYKHCDLLLFYYLNS